MIQIKTDKEIEVMKVGGQKLSRILDILLERSIPGASLLELDRLAEIFLLETGGAPAFKGYHGFPGSICASVNDGLVHGVPSRYMLKTGDLLSIDIGLCYGGFYSDMARTVIINASKLKQDDYERKNKFLDAGKKALITAIAEVRKGNFVGDISAAMQSEIEQVGFSVSRTFTGHGIGCNLHEDPSIPCFGKIGDGEKLKENMVLAIEVIYAAGKADGIISSKDNWTVVTKDNSWGGLFEDTIVVTSKDPLVLTKS